MNLAGRFLAVRAPKSWLVILSIISISAGYRLQIIRSTVSLSNRPCRSGGRVSCARLTEKFFKLILQISPNWSPPGFCDALAVASAPNLLASFHNLGVYELTKDWKLRFKAPYPSTDGEHWVHLAENNGQIALSVSPLPQLVAEKNSSDYKTVYNSFAALWIFDGQKLENIPFPKK